MRASVGGVSLLNIFIVFFLLITFLLTGTVMYYKGYKVNSKIIESIERYEGYNQNSAQDIDRVLSSLGYRQSSNNNCIDDSRCYNPNYDFKLTCSLDTKADANNSETINGRYIKYTVTTYIFIDLPLGVGTIKLPVTTRTNPIYQFKGHFDNAEGC